MSVQDGRPAATVAAGDDTFARREANDSTRAGRCTTRAGSTAADTTIQSVDRHTDDDEATFVLWSRGRLEHICDGDTSLLWSIAAAVAVGAVLNAGMQPDRHYTSQTLFCLLVMLIEGRALTIAENCNTEKGLEVWRKLVDACEPKAGTRAAGLLVKILTVEFDLSDLLNSLEKWDNMIRHHATVDELEGVEGSVKIATLLSRMGKGIVQDHFLVGVSMYTLRATQEGPGRVLFSEEAPRWRQLRSARRRSRAWTVKGQHGKRQHQQPTGGIGGKGQHHQQTCEHCGKPGNVKKFCWYAKKGQPSCGTGMGKSGDGSKARTKTTKPSRSASGAARQAT